MPLSYEHPNNGYYCSQCKGSLQGYNPVVIQVNDVQHYYHVYCYEANVAQPVEQVPRKDEVAGSTPSVSSNVCMYCKCPIRLAETSTGWKHVNSLDFSKCNNVAVPMSAAQTSNPGSNDGFNNSQRDQLAIIVSQRVKMEENRTISRHAKDEGDKITKTYKEAMRTIQDRTTKANEQYKYHERLMIQAENSLRADILNGITIGQTLPKEVEPEPESEPEVEQIGRAE